MTYNVFGGTLSLTQSINQLYLPTFIGKYRYLESRATLGSLRTAGRRHTCSVFVRNCKLCAV